MFTVYFRLLSAQQHHVSNTKYIPQLKPNLLVKKKIDLLIAGLPQISNLFKKKKKKTVSAKISVCAEYLKGGKRSREAKRHTHGAQRGAQSSCLVPETYSLPSFASSPKQMPLDCTGRWRVLLAKKGLRGLISASPSNPHDAHVNPN